MPAQPRLGPHTATILFPTLLASIIIVVCTPGDYRVLAAPLLVMIDIAVAYIVVLWNRDGSLPVFEVGTLWVAATLVYGTFPFLGFMVSGLGWSPTGDGRLLRYDFDLAEVGAFAWRYVVYFASFVSIYLAIRGTKSVRRTAVRDVSAQLIAALVIILFLQYAFAEWMKVSFGLDYDISYAEAASRIAAGTPSIPIPYFLMQISGVVLASMLLVKQALLLALMQRWSSRRWRWGVIAWLTIEVVHVVLRMGARQPAVLLLLSFAALYHRLVRPLRLRWIVIGGALLLSGFLVQGLIREGAATQTEVRLTRVLTDNNEFQVLFTTAFDIYKRKETGTLGTVPWQVYFIDLYLEIPSQILPFEKIDPSAWYLDVIGARDTGVGFMFGVISQAVLGLDWIELVLRGALLGALLAAFHRWYARHASRFWVTLIYLFVAVWTYYTFRATSFWFLHFVIYQFVPVMLAATFIAFVLGRVDRRRTA
jgi:hypothetical protein